MESFVAIWATVDGVNIDADPVQVPLIPAIYVEEEILLIEETQSAELIIFGLPQILEQVNVSI